MKIKLTHDQITKLKLAAIQASATYKDKFVWKQIKGMGPRNFLYADDGRFHMPILELESGNFPLYEMFAGCDPETIKELCKLAERYLDEHGGIDEDDCQTIPDWKDDNE